LVGAGGGPGVGAGGQVGLGGDGCAAVVVLDEELRRISK